MYSKRGLIRILCATSIIFAGCLDNPKHSNHPPMITSEPVIEVNEGEQYRYPIIIKDEDENDTLELSLIESPEWLSINSETRELSGVAPEVDFNSSHPLTINVFDGDDSVQQSYNLKVKDLTIPRIVTRAAID
ncbi:MAG: Ig domain-containing protein [Nanoarchaeota archaeon]